MFYLLAFIMASTDGLKHVLAKVSGQRISVSIINLIWTISAMLIYAVAIIWFGFSMPGDTALYLMIVNALIISVSMYFYTEGLKHTDISLSVPMLSLSPIVTAIITYFLNGETLKPLNIGGILLVVVGIYLLYEHKNIFSFVQSIKANKGAQMILVTSMLWGVAAGIDKLIISTVNPQSYLFIINIFLLVIFAAGVLVRAKSVSELKQNLVDHDIRPEGMPFLTGIVDAISVLIQMFLFTLYNPAQVIAFKRTSLLFGELFAAGILKEKIQSRLMPTIVIISGAILSLI